MARMTDTPRGGRRPSSIPAVAGTEKSVSASDVVVAPPASAAPDTGAVLPDPTLTAETGAPKPIVTASPPLAAEPDALDVAKVQLGGRDPEHSAAGDPANPAVAGQTMLTIDRVGIGAVGGDGFAERMESVASNPRLEQGVPVLTIDQVIHNLELLAHSDPIGMDMIRTRFFSVDDRAPGDVPEDRTGRPGTATVTLIEVVGPPQGRRRAGRMFGPKAQRFLGGELNADDIAQLRSDPLLAIGVSEVEADAFGMPITGR